MDLSGYIEFFLFPVNISMRIFEDNGSFQGLYGGLYGKNLTYFRKYKFKNCTIDLFTWYMYGVFQNWSIYWSPERSETGYVIWKHYGIFINTSFGIIETKNNWVITIYRYDQRWTRTDSNMPAAGGSCCVLVISPQKR
jgi:hypothetical protein